jgi:hypothetical protein
VYELADRDTPRRWARFFAHTSQAAPIAAGVELVKALDRLGWRYSVSSTRPAWSRAAVGSWVRENAPLRPEWIYVYRTGGVSAAECKRLHYVDAMVSRAPVCGLFVDDEQPIVDELVDLAVPAMHIDDLAGLSDDELGELLRYSVKNTAQRRLELRAAARENGSPKTVRQQAMARGRAAAKLAQLAAAERDGGGSGGDGGPSVGPVDRGEFTDGALGAALNGANGGMQGRGGDR